MEIINTINGKPIIDYYDYDYNYANELVSSDQYLLKRYCKGDSEGKRNVNALAAVMGPGWLAYIAEWNKALLWLLAWSFLLVITFFIRYKFEKEWNGNVIKNIMVFSGIQIMYFFIYANQIFYSKMQRILEKFGLKKKIYEKDEDINKALRAQGIGNKKDAIFIILLQILSAFVLYKAWRTIYCLLLISSSVW